MRVKMKARRVAETSWNTKPATQCHIPEDLNHQRQGFMWFLGYESRFWDIFHAFPLEYKHVPKTAKWLLSQTENIYEIKQIIALFPVPS